jgi:hypothetical protein
LTHGANLGAVLPVMAGAAGTDPACAAMGGAERYIAGCLRVADGTRCRADGIVTKRGTINALTAFFKISAHDVHCGTRAAQIAVTLCVDAHIMILRANMTAKVNGIEIARHPDRCLFLTHGDYCWRVGKGLLHIAYLLIGEK